MHFNFIDIVLLRSGRQHVSATHMVIFRVIFFRTRILYIYNVPKSLHGFKNHTICG